MTTPQTSAATKLAARSFLPGMAHASTAPQVKEVPFYSTTGEPVHIALTTGHTAIVDTLEGSEGAGSLLHPRFHREAVTRGCLPLGAEDFKLPLENAPPTRTAVIMGKLRDMIDGNEPDDFTAAGLPNLNALQRLCGFKVTREEADAAWSQVKAG